MGERGIVYIRSGQVRADKQTRSYLSFFFFFFMIIFILMGADSIHEWVNEWTNRARGMYTRIIE